MWLKGAPDIEEYTSALNVKGPEKKLVAKFYVCD